MSKGMGWVQREILTAFRQSSVGYFSTSDLCKLVYKTENVEKKHRVAVLRALRKLAGKELRDLWKWKLQHEQADDVWYDYRRMPLRGAGRSPVINK